MKEPKPWEPIPFEEARRLSVGLTARWRVRVPPWTFEAFDLYESRLEEVYGAVPLKPPRVVALAYRHVWEGSRLVYDGEARTAQQAEPAYWWLGTMMEQKLAGIRPAQHEARPAFRPARASQTTLA